MPFGILDRAGAGYRIGAVLIGNQKGIKIKVELEIGIEGGLALS